MASIDFKKSNHKKTFLLHVDISENVFYTIFKKFSKWVTKFEGYDEIRSLDGTYFCKIKNSFWYHTMIPVRFKINVTGQWDLEHKRNLYLKYIKCCLHCIHSIVIGQKIPTFFPQASPHTLWPPAHPSLSQTPPQLKNPADVPARALLSLDVFGTSTGIGTGFPTKYRTGIYFVPLRYRYRFNLKYF